MIMQSQAIFLAKHFPIELPSRHVKGIHLKIKEFKCDACDYASVEKKSVANHRRAIHGYRTDPDNVDHVCDICEKSFANMESFRKHKLYIHDKVKSYSCDECEYAASRKDHLNRHKAKMHASNSAASVEKSKIGPGTNESHFVRERFQEDADNSEETTSPKIKEWVCDMCEYVATQKSCLVEHVHNIHWKGTLAGSNAEKL